MGYRSDTAFVIEFDTKENAGRYFEAITTEVTKDYQVECTGRFIHMHHDNIKWYDSYPEIQELQAVFMNSADAEGYVGYLFKRFGEDNNDYEVDENGEPPWECIEELRRLELNVAEA